MIYKEILMMMH